MGRSVRRGTHEPLGFIVVNSGKLIVRFDLGLYVERQYQGDIQTILGFIIDVTTILTVYTILWWCVFPNGS